MTGDSISHKASMLCLVKGCQPEIKGGDERLSFPGNEL